MGRYLDIARSSAIRLYRVDLKGLGNGSNREPLAQEENPNTPTKETNLTKEAFTTPAAAWEVIQERATIMQFDGGLSREQADLRAFQEWFKEHIGDDL